MTLVVPEERKLIAAGTPSALRTFDRQATNGPWTLSCTGRSCDGAVVELVAAKGSLPIMVLGTHWRLPPAAAPLMAAKPEHAQPQYLPHATILIGRMRV